MNSYEQKTSQDLERLFEVHGVSVTEDCLNDVLQYFSAETRRSFLSGLKRHRASGSPYKTALQGGRLRAVEQSG